GAVAVVAGAGGGLEAIGRIVDVGVGEGAGGGRSPRVGIGHAAGLDHGAADVAGNHGGVVGAGDGDGDDLLGAVGGQDRERVGRAAAVVVRLHSCVALVELLSFPTRRSADLGAVAVVAGAGGGLEAIGRI